MNGAISTDLPTAHRPPARKSGDEAEVSASAEAGSSLPAFAEVLGATQARFGTRIGAMVQSIVPDGRGLRETKPGATEQRLGEQGQDAEQAHLRKREALRDASSEEPVRTRPGQTRHEAKSETARDPANGQSGSGPAAPERRTGPGCVSPAGSDGSRSAASPPIWTAVEAVSSKSADRPATLTPSAAASSASALPSVAETAASQSGMASAPAVPADGGILAERIGELLGARPAAESGGRAGSVSAAEPVGTAESARKESSGSSRPADTPKPPPGRSHTAPEAAAGKRGAFDRLVRSVRTQVGPRVSTARLQLTPPELGRVRIDVRVVQERMELSIRAQTPEARDVLTSRLAELRTALADHGLTLDRCDVTLAPTGDALSRGDRREDFGRRAGRDVAAVADTRPRAGDGSSEGEDTDSASAEAVEWEGLGAPSEMRLDIRV